MDNPSSFFTTDGSGQVRSLTYQRMPHVVTIPAFENRGSGSSVLAQAICNRWTAKFEQALQHGKYDDFNTLFVQGCWIRDFLTLSWDFRTINGLEPLAEYFKNNATVGLTNIRMRESGAYKPKFKVAAPNTQWIESMFEFDTNVGRGKGMVRLVLDPEEADTWKCYLINFTLQELKGHEEKTGVDRPDGYVNPSGGNWQERLNRQREFLDEDPTVLVIGAGQAGLDIGARLSLLQVPTLIIERHDCIGDSWRKRYRTLMTHDPIHYCHMAYLPFPPNWPNFMPKDKLADWLESYANIMELNVWCKTSFRKASFDDATATWTVELTRADGSTRILKPKHVVLATGNVGDAIVPDIPDKADFKGALYHGSEHTDASAHSELATKKVVVVGSGNSAHDLCQNFYESGAGSVTMLQRGGTYVLTARKGLPMLHTGSYEEGGPPIDDCDVAGQSKPIPIQFALNVHECEAISIVDKKILDGLAKAGFKVDKGEDNSGIFRKYITRGGGYYIDVGCSQLIIDEKVKVKSSPGGIKALDADGLILADGSKLPADIIVLATGYETMHGTARKLFGDEIGDRLGKVWDLNDEGEVNSMWRYSGHPSFWFMGGNLALCRSYSRLLALQIKASELGIYRRP